MPAVHGGEDAGDESVLSSAAATPRGDDAGADAFYNPYRAAAAALQQQLAAAATELAALEAANEDLQQQLAAAREEAEVARGEARDLDSRASVAEDSRSAASQVRAAVFCVDGWMGQMEGGFPCAD